MEELLLLNKNQLKYIYEQKDRLENQYLVKIYVPPADNFEFANTNDMFFTNVCGSESSISSIKEVLTHCEEVLVPVESEESAISVITLSDDDSDVPIAKEEIIKRPKKRKIIEEVDLTYSPVVQCNKLQCEIISTTMEPAFKKTRSDIKENDKKMSRGQKRALIRKAKKKKANIQAEEFIPLISKNSKFAPQKTSLTQEKTTQKKTISNEPKVLRPVVIDGSNIAREHGKSTHSYSCKGIQISIDYFLNRGHSSVTAFVPNFRRHCTNGIVPTTDEAILEKLAVSGHVVFTPSRKVNGKRLTPYDDRFIVDLASRNGGVIVSNDNYKDLIGENEEFKKTIEERLLMFCFVGDIIMIPNDPLGRDGPTLDEFLSFPSK